MKSSTKFKFLSRDILPYKVQIAWHYAAIYLNDVKRSDLTKQASAMAYITLFSLVPSLAAIFTLLGLFLPMLGDNSQLMDEGRQFLLKYLATGSGPQVIEYLEKFITGLNLKHIGVSAFIGLMITLIVLLRQIEEALNRIWIVDEPRTMLTRFIYFWLFLTLGMFGISMVIGLSTHYSLTALITKKTMEVADKADDIFIVAATFNWLVGCGLFYLIYKVVPNCEVRNRPAAYGAALAGTLFYGLGKFYTVYVSNYANYKNIYGTLAALPVFLMWIYVCWLVILAGALFAWRFQTGFPPLTEDKTIETATTGLELHRNHAIRTALPILTVMTIYQEFEMGTGDGISTGDLVARFHMPFAWIQEAVNALRELKFIVAGKVSPHSIVTGVLIDGERWFPTQPATKMQLDYFQSALNSSYELWFKHWDPDVALGIRHFIAELARDTHEHSTETIHEALIRLSKS